MGVSIRLFRHWSIPQGAVLTRVLSRDQLLDLTSGRPAEVWDRSIDNQVSRLRRKIEVDPAQPALIKTCWGDGYQFVGKVRKS
jgi:two-component system OmpR family response regulator